MNRFHTMLSAGVAALILAPATAAALTLTGAAFSLDVDQTPADVAVVEGVFDAFFGPASDAIDLDVTTGAINVDEAVAFDFVFAAPVANGVGADLILIDGRFGAGAVEISIDGGGAYFPVAASDFVDSGVSEALDGFGGPFAFTPFVASIDLSDFGVLAGTSFTTLRLRATNDELDLMAVASLTPRAPGGGAAEIPLPGAAPLLLLGLAGLALQRRGKG